MHRVVRGTVAAALIGVALLGFACSDDGGGALTLEEYFAELQELDDRFEEEGDQLDAAFESEDLDEIKSAVDDGTTSAREFVDDIDALEPPDEAQEAHAEAVAAGNELVDALDTFNDAVQDADSTEALAEIEFGAIGNASDRFTQACLDMEALAADLDAELDLNCEEQT